MVVSITFATLAIYLNAYALDLLPPIDAHGVIGIRAITKSELLTLIAKDRPLSPNDKAQIDRGCLGLTCLYQGFRSLDVTPVPLFNREP
jgi:hypothetical protein